MPEDPNDEQTGFKITDRRMFDKAGELRPEAAAEKPPGTGPKPAPRAAPQPPKPERPSAERGRSLHQPGEEEEPTIDFGSFLLSMATSAMVHLGEVPDPATGRPVENMPAARQTIDVLNILKEKTQGNLTAEEQRLLDGLLYELRLKFLNKSKVIKF